MNVELFQAKRAIVMGILGAFLFIVFAMGTPGLAQERAASSPSETPQASADSADQVANPENEQKNIGAAKRSPEEVRSNIEIWQERVRKRLETIERMATALDLRKIESQKIAVEELQNILRDLDEEAKQIIDAHSGLGPDLKLYRQALEAAPGVFHQIANELEQRATSTKSNILQQNYADFASQSHKMAESYVGRAKGIDGLEADLAKRMEFVVESRVFISDVQGFLAAVPTQGGVETERLIGRINAYIDAFQGAISAMKGVANKIVEPGTNATPTLPNPHSTSSIQLYRQRLQQIR